MPDTSLPATVTLALGAERGSTPSLLLNWFSGIVFVTLPEAEPGGAVTGTVIVQVPGFAGVPAGIWPPARLTLVEVVETVPGAQVVVAVPATTNGVGKLSVSCTPVYGVLFGFCKVMVNVFVPPVVTVEDENPFVTPISRTFNRAVAGALFVRF